MWAYIKAKTRMGAPRVHPPKAVAPQAPQPGVVRPDPVIGQGHPLPALAPARLSPSSHQGMAPRRRTQVLRRGAPVDDAGHPFLGTTGPEANVSTPRGDGVLISPLPSLEIPKVETAEAAPVELALAPDVLDHGAQEPVHPQETEDLGEAPSGSGPVVPSLPEQRLRNEISTAIAEISQSNPERHVREIADVDDASTQRLIRRGFRVSPPTMVKQNGQQIPTKGAQLTHWILRNPALAQEAFEDCLRDPHASRSEKVGGAWNLIKLAERGGQDASRALHRAYRMVLAETSPAQDQPTRVLTALIYSQVMRDDWTSMSEAEQQELARAVLREIQTSDVFLEVAYPDCRRTVLQDKVMDSTVDPALRTSFMKALQKAQAREQGYQRPQLDGDRGYNRLSGFASAALGDLLALEWKQARSRNPVEGTVSAHAASASPQPVAQAAPRHDEVARVFQGLPKMSGAVRESLSLRAFDLFQHGSPVEKDMIAATLFAEVEKADPRGRMHALYEEPYHMINPDAVKLFSNFAGTMMCAHHLMNAPQCGPSPDMIEEVFSALLAFKSIPDKSYFQQKEYPGPQMQWLEDFHSVAETTLEAMRTDNAMTALVAGRPQDEIERIFGIVFGSAEGKFRMMDLGLI